MNLDTKISQSDEIISTDLDGKLVMMSIENGEYYALDAVSKRIWELIEQPTHVHSICQTLLSEFDVDNKDCEREVLDFATKLADMKIIRVNYE